LTRLPAALFIVDIVKEHIAVAEAHKLNIPTYAIVDTNTDPNKVDYPIPANDDAASSVAYITEIMCKAIAEGLSERKLDKESAAEERDKSEENDEVVDTLGNLEGVAEEETSSEGGGKILRKRTTKK